MLSEKRLTSLAIIMSLVFLMALSVFPDSSHYSGRVSAESNPVLTQAPVDVSALEEDTMYVGIYLIDIYDFEYKTGSYTYDFYIYFSWINPDITQADWLLMNGYPVDPSYRTLVRENTTGVLKTQVYRVRAFLDSNPDPTNYPFDTMQTPISVELLPSRSNSMSFSWFSNETGINPDFTNQGWEAPYFELQTSITDYPFGNSAPRADMIIQQDRNLYGALTKTILPPLIFCLVAGACFLFKMYDESAFGLRVGIATSMLITAILFNISEQNDLPPVSSITIYGALTLAVTTFLAIVTVVTVLGYVDWMRRQDKNHVERINKIGFIVSLAVPVLIFVALFLIK